MEETSISAAVGSHPSPNRPNDVKIVQTLLGRVDPPLSIRVDVTGAMDWKTLTAIREFQSRFMKKPDSRVDPRGRTLGHLNAGFVSKYIHCNLRQQQLLHREIVNAQRWLDVVIQRFNSLDDDAKGKVKNVFHIDADAPMGSVWLTLLRMAYTKLRVSLNASFPLQCESTESATGAWVLLGDPTGTMHFSTNYFKMSASRRTETMIHERSHTVFGISHAGMRGAGELNFGIDPGDDNGLAKEQAAKNAYCYGWLATALQPGYAPQGVGVITVTPRRK